MEEVRVEDVKFLREELNIARLIIEALQNELLMVRDNARELREALLVTRGQWIHSVNAGICLAALGEKP
jgi:hypothetical protein